MIISSTGNVSRTNGHINGNFQKYIATGPTSKTFEVGDASDYAPVSVVFGNVSSAGNLTAKTTDNDHPDIANSGIDPAKSVNRYWTMTKDANLAFSTYSATFYFVAGDIDSGADWNNFIVAKKNGSWTKPAVGERTSTSIQALNMDSFSDYQIGESSAAITLTLSTSTVDLGILVPQIPITATTTATVFVSGYNNGYYLAIKRDSSTSTLALQSNPIIIFPDYSPGWDPTANGGNGNATTTPGLTFSFRLMSSGTDSNYNSNWWGLNDNEGTAKFAGMPLTTQTIMTCSSLVCQNGTTTNVILYRADAPLIQPIGIYSGDITITALGNP